MFYVYIMANRRNGTLYTGHTDDLGRRMEEHKFGTTRGFARKYGCDKLVWFEEYPTRDSAFKRERQIKEWRRRWKLELIEAENPHWLDIAELPVWPLPKGELLSNLRQTLIAGQLDPDFRRDERKSG